MFNVVLNKYHRRNNSW